PGAHQEEEHARDEADRPQGHHQHDETGGSQRPIGGEHGTERARLSLRSLPLFGHDCDPINAVSAREAPMPRAVRPGPDPPKAKRQRPVKKASPDRVAEIFARLAAAKPDPKGELENVNPFTLLVAVVLSAQATDAGVNKATQGLFKVADTPKKMLALGEAALQERIKTIGLFRMKAKNVIALSQKLIAEHGGQVPREREALEALPGVGRKTANVVLNIAFGEPTLA